MYNKTLTPSNQPHKTIYKFTTKRRLQATTPNKTYVNLPKKCDSKPFEAKTTRKNIGFTTKRRLQATKPIKPYVNLRQNGDSKLPNP